MKVDEGKQYVPSSLLKGDSSEKSSVNMRYNRIFKKTSQVCIRIYVGRDSKNIYVAYNLGSFDIEHMFMFTI